MSSILKNNEVDTMDNPALAFHRHDKYTELGYEDEFSQDKWVPLASTKFARNSINPIRRIVDEMKLDPNPQLPLIPLSIGDPTTFGNLPVPDNVIESVVNSLRSNEYNGYVCSEGSTIAREAVARYISLEDNVDITSDDVILTSGCSRALDICISGLAEVGQNVLVPSPGFPLYKTLANGNGIEIKTYKCLPEREWQCDLNDMRRLIDSRTAAILLCNPSNPCGGLFSKEHILDILDLAEKKKIPIISDEIYANMVYPGEKFYSVASLSTNVPILTCGGIGKRFLIPGWRLGWISVHDKHGVFAHEIRKGLTSITQRILGPTSFIEAALPSILFDTPKSFFDKTTCFLQSNASLCFDYLSKVEGLIPYMPRGAMYFMVGIEIENFPSLKDDVEFTSKLVTEQSVFCLPSQCFEFKNFFRIVLTVPEEKLEEALQRIQNFCQQYYKSNCQ